MTRELVDEPMPSWHRALIDSYSEADLMWLEADGIIRELSGGKRGLDDFADTFFDGGGEKASLYDFNDVVAGLEKVQHYDWATFLHARIDSVAPAAPADWLRRSGYRLVFSDTATPEYVEHERKTNRVDLTTSIGVMLHGGDSGEVSAVIWESPAFNAGIVEGATIVAVNGERYETAKLRTAILGNHNGGAPIRLLVSSRGQQREVTIDYRGGLRYPRLERDSGMRDRLGGLLMPRAAAGK